MAEDRGYGLRAERDSLPRSERGFKGVRRSTPLLNKRSFEAGLGVQEEVGGGHDAVAFREAEDHLDAIAEPGAQLDLAWVQPTTLPVHEDDAAVPGVDHRAVRHDQAGAEIALQE